MASSGGGSAWPFFLLGLFFGIILHDAVVGFISSGAKFQSPVVLPQ